MKKIILFYFLISSIFSFSQGKVINGVVIDINTKKPIDIVSISIVGTNINTVSNNEGKFRISVPEGFTKLSLSHISYTSIIYEIKDNKNIDLYLTPKEYLLDEVIVNQFDTSELLNDICNTSMEKILQTTLLNTYYCEYVKVDTKYTNFSDGLLDYYIQASWKDKKFNSDLCVKQSRVADFTDSNSSIDVRELKTINVNDIGKAILYAYTSGFCLSTDFPSKNDYNYNIKTKTEVDGNSIGFITITPKTEIEKEEMMIISITYDPKTKLILDIDAKYSPDHKKYTPLKEKPFGKYKPFERATKVSFKIDGDKYVMTHYQKRINIFIWGKGDYGGDINNTFEFTTDITTLNYTDGDFKLAKSKVYKKNNLFANGNRYKEEFWKNQNVKLLTNEEEKIIEILNQKSSPATKKNQIK